MAHYIDGFVLPVPRDRLNEYQRLAEAVAGIWKEHGALDYREYVGDDGCLEGTRSFTDLVAATEDESIVFGWVIFDSREARDLANEKVAADPRMADLVESSNSGFDAKRMAYGGFQPLVPSSDASAETHRLVSMTTIQLKELRERTGANLMECKRALNEAKGDIVLARRLLGKDRNGDESGEPDPAPIE